MERLHVLPLFFIDMRIVVIESADKENGKIPHAEISQMFESHAKEGDFWILPEVFDTGWNINGETEISGGKNFVFFQQNALKYKISVCGSYYEQADGKFYNRFCVVTKDGRSFFAGKRHLFGVFEKTSVVPG